MAKEEDVVADPCDQLGGDAEMVIDWPHTRTEEGQLVHARANLGAVVLEEECEKSAICNPVLISQRIILL
jgi:hypothetical protein